MGIKMKETTEIKFYIFGLPAFLIFIPDFMVLTMQFGKPFCLDCFTNGIIQPWNIMGLGIAYVILSLMLYAVVFGKVPMFTQRSSIS